MTLKGTKQSTGPRIGSRVWALQRLEPGEALFIEVPENRTNASFAGQMNGDIQRAGGRYCQDLLYAVDREGPTVVQIIRITRLE